MIFASQNCADCEGKLQIYSASNNHKPTPIPAGQDVSM